MSAQHRLLCLSFLMLTLWTQAAESNCSSCQPKFFNWEPQACCTIFQKCCGFPNIGRPGAGIGAGFGGGNGFGGAGGGGFGNGFGNGFGGNAAVGGGGKGFKKLKNFFDGKFPFLGFLTRR